MEIMVVHCRWSFVSRHPVIRSVCACVPCISAYSDMLLLATGCVVATDDRCREVPSNATGVNAWPRGCC